MKVALTFDDGPSRWTAPILDLLAAHDAYATFFVCGVAVREHPEVVERAFFDFHEIGNHSFYHPHLPALETGDVEFELRATSEAIEAITGQAPTLWRAPHFDRDAHVVGVAASLGLAHVGCTLDPGDWLAVDGAALAKRVLANLVDGSVVDLHDGIPPNGGSGTQSRQPTVDALALILAAKPAEFVTVSGLA